MMFFAHVCYDDFGIGFTSYTMFVWVTMFCGRLSKDNKDEVLEKAGKDLEAVREQHFSRLMKELQGTDFWKLRRAYSPGVYDR